MASEDHFEGYYYSSWLEVEQRIANFKQDLFGGSAPDLIVGVSRGGLVPAVMLAHMYDVHVPVDVIHWSLRDSNEKHIPVAVRRAIIEYKNVVIVDDILDTGITMGEIMRTLHTSARYSVQDLCVYDRVFDAPLIGDKFVVFPWEKDPR